MITEKFLHYIWQYKLFSTHLLQTEASEKVEIIDIGKPNTDAGPDFFNAKLKIGETLWAGNVEIHLNSSDWNKHGHHKNPAYDSVILHVVHEIDCPVYRTNGETIPQMQLCFPNEIIQRYQNLQGKKSWISCEEQLLNADKFLFAQWINRILIERLETKSKAIFTLLEQNKNNWEEAFYITLARNFGFGTNGDTFEQLARALPLSCLGKHKDNLFQIEALLFGQSGLLSLPKENADEYQQSLQKEYDFLRSKFTLTPIDGNIWKLLRLRPSNFPHIRIAQFAGLIHKSSKLFSKIIENHTLENLRKLFVCETSEYWKTHYLFGEKSNSRNKKIGETAINTILINTVVPFLFCYGKNKQNADLQDAALSLLENLPVEQNSITLHFAELGIFAKSAYDSQALIQLKKRYCDDKKCLQCQIGHKIMSC